MTELRGPLEGITVLDMTRFIAGPYCTMLLGDHGARVIKVEPLGGDEIRAIPPMLGDAADGCSIYFARFARNKESICLDLKSERGREVFEDLVAHADVLVENFRAGVLERLGFSAERLSSINDQLIYCSISGFGHTAGPYRERPAFAQVVEAMGGAVRYNPPDNDPPLTLGVYAGDLFPASHAVSAVAMALFERTRIGRGRHIDISMYDGVLSLNERTICFAANLGVDSTPGNITGAETPQGIFKVKDGYITLAVAGNRIWTRFCQAIGREDLLEDPRLSSGPARAESFDDVLRPVMDEWLLARTRREAVAALLEHGVPSGEVMSPFDVIEDEHAKSRDMFSIVPSFAGVDVKVAASPIPLGPRRIEPIPAPGEQTVAILRELAGYDETEIQALIGDGVVETWPVAEPSPA